jgi:hypothetical protein
MKVGRGWQIGLMFGALAGLGGAAVATPSANPIFATVEYVNRSVGALANRIDQLEQVSHRYLVNANGQRIGILERVDDGNLMVAVEGVEIPVPMRAASGAWTQGATPIVVFTTPDCTGTTYVQEGQYSGFSALWSPDPTKVLVEGPTRVPAPKTIKSMRHNNPDNAACQSIDAQVLSVVPLAEASLPFTLPVGRLYLERSH